MKSSAMLSIQPYWVFLIIARKMGWNIPLEKKVEVRKAQPNPSVWNREALIYCSKNKKSFHRIPAEYQPYMAKLLGKVIGEFICDEIEDIMCLTNGLPEGAQEAWYRECKGSCLSTIDLMAYGKGKILYGMHISDLKIYDTPKELSEFKSPYLCSFGKDNGCWVELCKYNHECVHYSPAALTRPPQSWCYVEKSV